MIFSHNAHILGTSISLKLELIKEFMILIAESLKSVAVMSLGANLIGNLEGWALLEFNSCDASQHAIQTVTLCIEQTA